MHEHRLVHTDLKPENILLLSGDSNVVGSTSSKCAACMDFRLLLRRGVNSCI